MKYVKYTLVVLSVLIVVFLLIGVVVPGISYDCEITVDKSLEESWNVAQDEEKMSEWLEGYQKMEHVSGPEGAVGAVSNVYFDNDGQEMVIKETITALQPHESIEMLFETDFMNMDYELRMASEGTKTKISSLTQVEGNSMFSRSVIALMGSSFKAEEEKNLLNLKKAIEANQKRYSVGQSVNLSNR